MVVNKPNSSNSSYDLPTSFSGIYSKERFSAQQLSDGYDPNNAGSLGNIPNGYHVNWKYDIDFRWLKYFENKTDQTPQPNGVSDATKLLQVNSSGTAYELKNTNDIRTSINAPDIINSDITLNVPSNYSDINIALASLEGRYITNNAFVTIQVADGSYNYTSEINIKHPNGSRIKIIGNITTPANCTLNFSAGINGVKAENGNVLGLINGFKIKGVNDSTTNGLSTNNGGIIITGNKIIIEDFGIGVSASNNAIIYAKGITVNSSVNIGILAFNAGFIYAESSISQNNNQDGFNATYGSTIIANSATAQYNGASGYTSTYNSVIQAGNSMSNNNTQHGFAVDFSGCINSTYSISNNNGIYGYYASGNATNYVLYSSASGNGTANYNPVQNIEGTLGGWNLA